MSLPDRPSPPTIPTPPSTILNDAVSPTTSDPNIPDLPMPGNKAIRPLYLIVATAVEPHLGIGYQGGFPWTKGLKTDMAFFRQVTMRGGRAGEERKPGDGYVRGWNSVIMGRKTWESIPAQFRPLKGRVNVVITRNVAGLKDEIQGMGGGVADVGKLQQERLRLQEEVVVVSSLKEALRALRELREAQTDGEPTTEEDFGGDFVIGGSGIYKAALELPSMSSTEDDQGREGKSGLLFRILQTQVRRLDRKAFDCDTFFPIDLPGVDSDRAGGTRDQGWRMVDRAESESWIGQGLPQKDSEWTEDAGGECEIRVVGWEKTS